MSKGLQYNPDNLSPAELIVRALTFAEEVKLLEPSLEKVHWPSGTSIGHVKMLADRYRQTAANLESIVAEYSNMPTDLLDEAVRNATVLRLGRIARQEGEYAPDS